MILVLLAGKSRSKGADRWPKIPLCAPHDSGTNVRFQRTGVLLPKTEAVLSSWSPGEAVRRAELTQLVECQLPKLDVAGSTPVLRSFSCPSFVRPSSASVAGSAHGRVQPRQRVRVDVGIVLGGGVAPAAEDEQRGVGGQMFSQK